MNIFYLMWENLISHLVTPWGSPHPRDGSRRLKEHFDLYVQKKANVFIFRTNRQRILCYLKKATAFTAFSFERRSSPAAAHLYTAIPIQNYVALALLAVLPGVVGQVARP